VYGRKSNSNSFGNINFRPNTTASCLTATQPFGKRLLTGLGKESSINPPISDYFRQKIGFQPTVANNKQYYQEIEMS
jgi:hypothetical protein